MLLHVVAELIFKPREADTSHDLGLQLYLPLLSHQYIRIGCVIPQVFELLQLDTQWLWLWIVLTELSIRWIRCFRLNFLGVYSFLLLLRIH
jgi:hypothetical protein